MSAGRDRIAGMVETTITADSLRPAAYGLDEDEIGVVGVIRMEQKEDTT